MRTDFRLDYQKVHNMEATEVADTTSDEYVKEYEKFVSDHYSVIYGKTKLHLERVDKLKQMVKDKEIFLPIYHPFDDIHFVETDDKNTIPEQ